MSIGIDNLIFFKYKFMRSCLLLISMALFPLFSQSIDSLLTKIFPPKHVLFHYPPTPFFQGRPYFLELFVEIPWDSLENASIFFKTEKSVEYQEIFLEKYRGRLRFKYDSDSFPGDTLHYFFMATKIDFSLYATPLDTTGRIKPMMIQPVDPNEYFESIQP